MNQSELKGLLESTRRVRIGILGDFCLDAYLLLEPNAAEISLETGLATRPVRSQRYSLGAAGNVANNLQAMGVTQLSVFGVIGNDPFGAEMHRLLTSRNIDTYGLLTQNEQWDTHVYMKPYEREQEQSRIDLGNFNQLDPSTANILLQKLEAALPTLDLIIINQHVTHGIHTHHVRQRLAALALRHPEKLIIADSRHFPDEYSGTIRKINIREAAKLCGKEYATLDPEGLEHLARSLYKRWKKPLFVTRGENGCMIHDQHGYKEAPGLLILSPVDPVGAGDSMLAGIAAALAAGAGEFTAAEFGTLVAGITVQKLMQTGTATAEEILHLGADPDRRYKPDLALQHQKAQYHSGTEIEIVTHVPQRHTFSHVILDHDGTISTLRQGWEAIMEPVMLRAILGTTEQREGDALYHHAVAAVRDYIDKTTGIQTLVQMKGLVNLVRRFKCVPESDILDEFGYKALYDEALSGLVRRRIQKVTSNELSVEDFTIKKAVPFLHALHQRGLKLYLASGTDQKDVEQEADVLCYRSLFGGRIYGAVGDITKEAKRVVLERILADIDTDGTKAILTIGDGPVEIRETRKVGGYAIGVASDEIRRYGLNVSKRRRLIEAGADLVIPDFSQMDRLMEVLFGG